MKYTSTRSKMNMDSTSAILEGLARDGGLYVPKVIPQISTETLKDESYQEIAVRILSLFFTDFSKKEISEAVSLAYSSTN